ncbi:threonine/serine exporter family protein [Anaerosalibacter sp. Marseille-P3206]|uniref:threonine/serine exporter family protein n=1 Tax=Anaerosalibacter sp. Marseille-P3206 TaxID=1871005 RepID=UPI00098739B2|nr:threonine/serine exporter family protein [Anaerosalibacter sp. Marseille-P3206]
MEFIKAFIFSFCGTLGFSVLFRTPRDSLIKTGILGGLGWVVNLIMTDFTNSSVTGMFFGALTVGILGEILAKRFKKPATIFIIPGIITLVPGAGMYYTMLALIKKRFYDAIKTGTETIFIAAAIAIGIILSSTLSNSIKRFKSK